MKLNDLTNMATPVAKFVSVSRRVGSYLLNSVFIAHAVADLPKMDSYRSAKVSNDLLRFIKRCVVTFLQHVAICLSCQCADVTYTKCYLDNTDRYCSYVVLFSLNVGDNVSLYHAQYTLGLFLFLLVCCCGTLTAGVCCPDDMRELRQSGS